MKALTRKNAPVKREDAMDVSDEEEEEESTPRPSTARAGASPRSASSRASTSSSVSRRCSGSSSSSGGGSGSKSSVKPKPGTAGKRKSTSPGERLTKKRAIEEAAKALKARSSNYSPSATTNTSGGPKPLRTMITSRPSTTTRGRGIPSQRQAPPRRVETSDEGEESLEEVEEDEVVVPLPRQPIRRRSLAPVSAPAPRRAAPAPKAPVQSARTNGGQSRRSYDKEEEGDGEVEKTQSMGVLGRLGHGLFKVLTYGIIILTTAFALHIGVETYQHYTPLCFSDSYSNQVMTGRPAEACKTTWSCPPLLLCHAGSISGVAGLEEAFAKVFGSSNSSPVPPTEVSEVRGEVRVEEPVESEEGAVEGIWEEEGEKDWHAEEVEGGGEFSEVGEGEWQADEEDKEGWAEKWQAEQAVEHEHQQEMELEMEQEEQHTPTEY